MSHPTHPSKDDSKQPENKVVLELRDVHCREVSTDTVRLRGVNLSVRQGDLVMIHLGRRQHARSFASLLQGLMPTASGEILFEEHSWTDRQIEQQFRMRSRIGRVFEDRAWINNLNVTENVTLRLHHHAFAPARLEQHIKQWTQTLHVPELDSPASRVCGCFRVAAVPMVASHHWESFAGDLRTSDEDIAA